MSNNLYPPIVESSMPAFVHTDYCEIYFAISSFNDLDSNSGTINHNLVQITVRDLKTNISVLNSSSEIIMKSIQVNNSVQGKNKYYIKINTSDIQGGFLLNQCYKVQIRFTSTSATTPSSTTNPTDLWLANNQEYFSEWSSVVLIYGISHPNFVFKNSGTSEARNLNPYEGIIAGTTTFNESEDKETIKSYRIIIRDNNSAIVQDSGIIYTNDYENPNQINYTINYNLINYVAAGSNKELRVTLRRETQHGYIDNIQQKFTVPAISDTAINLDFAIEPNNQQGYIGIKMYHWGYDMNRKINSITGNSLQIEIDEPTAKIRPATISGQTLKLFNVTQQTTDLANGTSFVIKRASNKQNNFNYWYEVGSFTILKNNASEAVWIDNTVEPGVWYKYYIIRYNSSGVRTSSFVSEHEYMVVTEDIFLSADGEQLKIRFDPDINNFSIKTSQGIIETIGSQFPYIRRNNNIFYKTFNLAGTITYFSDIGENLFNSSKQDLYGASQKSYQDYNQQHNINDYYDYIREKEFRNKVIDFLYKDNVKLFRSLTEGNILIKLTNITLTPNKTLNRLIYSFSCTAYEVDKNDYNSYKKYNMLSNKYRIA